MPEMRVDNIRSLVGQVQLDTSRISGIIGKAVRESLAQTLRDRVSGLGGKVLVTQVEGGGTRIELIIPPDIKDDQRKSIVNTFESMMSNIGAVNPGGSMSGKPSSGFMAVLANKGIM